ncbi:Coproporphyrinogen III oxidase [Pavlovales sp. CCMP2436]|nr:Coproporphyrinogen III oxidase [Pavlovales sp. CCMP2436]
MAVRLSAADPAARWERDEHARGVALVLEDGEVWEKGCVSITLIEDSVLTKERAEAISGRTGIAGVVEGARYSAAALSFVLHARSPLVPTLRGDVRWFRVGAHEWYGGGLDLTPSYLDEDDASHFHTCLRELCEAKAGSAEVYRTMKQTCDEYFYLPARAEHRGVGGVFYDDLAEPWAPDFSLALLDAALSPDGPYMPIVERRRRLEYSDEQREWQCIRRGRYVEFNLLYDRGVRFGLSPESVERVLVSSPPLVAWKFKAEPAAGTPEAGTLAVLRKPREWA